jgi:hypothetical protein
MGGLGQSVFDASNTSQFSKFESDGTNWVPLGVAYSITPLFKCLAVCQGNADLWTNKATFNQDIGIFISGGAFGSAPGALIGWKESGGFAGTFSPNAAFVEAVAPLYLVAGTTYLIALYWKTNRDATGSGCTIFAGAGPLPSGGNSGGAAGTFSPTRLHIRLVPVN